MIILGIKVTILCNVDNCNLRYVANESICNSCFYFSPIRINEYFVRIRELKDEFEKEGRIIEEIFIQNDIIKNIVVKSC